MIMTTECVERRAMRSDDVLQLHYMRDLIAGLSYQSVGDAYTMTTLPTPPTALVSDSLRLHI